jgi:hypothetical protein
MIRSIVLGCFVWVFAACTSGPMAPREPVAQDDLASSDGELSGQGSQAVREFRSAIYDATQSQPSLRCRPASSPSQFTLYVLERRSGNTTEIAATYNEFDYGGAPVEGLAWLGVATAAPHVEGVPYEYVLSFDVGGIPAKLNTQARSLSFPGHTLKLRCDLLDLPTSL